MKIKIPGFAGIVDIDAAVHEEAPNFTWREVTMDGTRTWKSEQLTWNAIALAKELQKLRNRLGRQFLITSWYRTPEANKAAGGVPGSLHLVNLAADIKIAGYRTGTGMADAIGEWPGGIGVYSNRVHLDLGDKKRWRSMK